MLRQTLKTCIDRILPTELSVIASANSLSENPANAPYFNRKSLLPGVMPYPPQPLLAALTGKLWKPGRTLGVGFVDGTCQVHEQVRKHAHTWSEFANIRFEFLTVSDAEIRISFQYTGSWSYIGTDALSVPPTHPTMNLGWLTHETDEEEFRRVVLHEFGHALGCLHEHQSPSGGIPWDKQAVYEYYQGPPNYWSKEEVDKNLFKRYQEDMTQYSSFDPQSIMLYPIPNQLTHGDFEIGWNNSLSPVDRKYIAALYPLESSATTDLEIGGKSVSASIGEHGEVDTFSFTVSHAASYRIETQGASDVMLSLFGPDDQTLPRAHDDNSGYRQNARIVTELSPGAYTVRVRHVSPRNTGRYQIGVFDA